MLNNKPQVQPIFVTIHENTTYKINTNKTHQKLLHCRCLFILYISKLSNI